MREREPKLLLAAPRVSNAPDCASGKTTVTGQYVWIMHVILIDVPHVDISRFA